MVTGRQMGLTGLVLAGATGALIWLPAFVGFILAIAAAAMWCRANEGDI